MNYKPNIMNTIITTSMYAVAYSKYNDLLNNTLLGALPNYWQSGCIFDTMLDFLALSTNGEITLPKGEKSITIKEAQKNISDILANYNYDIVENQESTQKVHANVYYQGSTYCPGAAERANWYDDAGWWGIACAKAFDPYYQHLFTEDTLKRAKSIAKSCLTAMKEGTYTQYKGAPNVYNTAVAQRNSNITKTAPRYQGGVWQANFGTPLNPETKLGPFQLSVVNGLWFTLCTRMYKNCDSEDLKKDLKPIISNFMTFFKNWVNDTDYSLLFKKNNSSTLVRERPPAYNDSVLQHQGKILVNPSSWYNNNTCWAGDQGLFLGGLYEFSTLNFSQTGSSEESFTNKTIQGILKGISELMHIDSTNSSSSVISPWYPTLNNHLQQTDPGDYASGSGICMRYLLYGYLKGSNPIKEALTNKNSKLYELINKSAKSSFLGNYPSFGNPSFDLFNNLSILTTAMALGITDKNLPQN